MPAFIGRLPRALALAAALLAACSGQPTTPPAPKTAQILFTPAELEFGLVVPGTTKSLPLDVANGGTGPLQITANAIVEDARGAFVVEGVPGEIAAGAHATVTVTYRAAAAETSDSGKLQIASNATNSPSAAIPLRARTAPASCADGVKDGDESAVDCGGASCPGCGAGKACGSAADCGAALACVDGVCGDCTQASQCRSGEVCEAGKCSGCESDAQCADGSTCEEGRCKACPGASGRIDTRTDAKNCGGCGIVCPAPANASAVCSAGQCGRTACNPGFFDFDGAATFGCETSCTGRTCTGPAGEIHVDNPPLPERALGQRALASGSSLGGAVQTSQRFTNTAVLGESTPQPAGGTRLRSTRFTLQGGLDPAQH